MIRSILSWKQLHLSISLSWFLPAGLHLLYLHLLIFPIEQINDISKISKVFEENGFGTLNITVKEMLITLLDDYSYEWVIEAIKIAVKNNKRTLRYVEGILQNWRAGGGMKLDSDKPKDNNAKKFDRRTKFHTAVSVTDGYTADDLNKKVDDIAEKKKQAMRDKNKSK